MMSPTGKMCAFHSLANRTIGCSVCPLRTFLRLLFEGFTKPFKQQVTFKDTSALPITNLPASSSLNGKIDEFRF
jgi:hypothetical protein